MNCGKNCLYHLFDGSVWSTSDGIVFLEEEGGFGLAADVFSWRNSNLKLHLLKKPVHNFVCFFFPQRSWNKLPAILCSVQVSRLPFTHGRLCSPSDDWRLYVKFYQQCNALQWSWYSYGGHLVQLQAVASPPSPNNWVLRSRSLHVWRTAWNRKRKAAEIVSCCLIRLAVVPRSIKTLLDGSDSSLQSRGSVLLVICSY